jgi:hypothetical protein
MASWPITDSEVSAYIGPMTDPERVTDSTLAAIAYVEARRSDLTDAYFAQLIAPDDVALGALIYASLLYNQRTSPSGYAAFGDGAIDVTGEPAYPRAMRLIGWRRPIAL